jgi:hypothetical protein
MAKDDAADLARRLDESGFAIVEAGQDTLALRRNTATFRKTTMPQSAVA